MKIVRPLSAIALQCALLAMSLVGSGFGCGVEADGAMHMAAGDKPMADMPGMPVGDQSSNDSRSDCSLPWALGGACQSMVSCSPNAIGDDARPDIAKTAFAHAPPAWGANHLRSVTRSPEPPPPRA